MTLPLTGFRILSLAEQLPGPLATMLLADLGADVILVERPSGGDPSRRFAGHFESLGRNKRSLTLDLKSDEGRIAFLKLVDTADVVVEGFRPGVMHRLGFGPEALRARRPGLVYVSISAFGQTGPMSGVAAHDLSIQGAAGLIDVPNGEEDGSVMPMLPLADIAAANAAALGIVAALLGRASTGHGATIDVSMLDSLVCWMAPFVVPALNGLPPAPLPPQDPAYGLFATADARQITISIAGEDHIWRDLCGILALDDLADLTEAMRITAASEVLQRLRAAVASHDLAWLAERFEAGRITFGPVHRGGDVAQNSQVIARGMIQDVAAPHGCPMRYVRQPLLIDGEGGTIKAPAPALGQHNAEILSELG